MEQHALPFPLLFAESVPEDVLDADPAAAVDVSALVSRIAGPARATGRRDAVLVLTHGNWADTRADLLGTELARRGARPFCARVDDLVTAGRFSLRLGGSGDAAGLLSLPAGDLLTDEVKSVWYLGPDPPIEPVTPRDEVERFVAREAAAAFRGLCSLLDGAFWVNRPGALYAADDKLGQLRVAAALGLSVPSTLVTSDPDTARRFFDSCRGEVVVKTFRRLGSTTRGRLTWVYTTRVLGSHLDQIELVRHGPCLFQEYVAKDVELRITIVGRRVFGAGMQSQRSLLTRDDSRRFAPDLSMYPCDVPLQIERACLRLMDHYGLAYGAIDLIRKPDGEYVFLELNANGDFLGVERGTGLLLAQAVVDLLVRAALP